MSLWLTLQKVGGVERRLTEVEELKNRERGEHVKQGGLHVEKEMKKEGVLTYYHEVGTSEERSRTARKTRSRRPDARSMSKRIKADGVEEIGGRLDKGRELIVTKRRTCAKTGGTLKRK